ncbi:hypothetical protein Pmar_PMAR017476 [Perkinsus marinus ATCC 50983]|uniref:Uncharacterized protein n=1 Tax=Perkinsus marinus (strain ATCC 50983 / TXsc) TaxID=423536 RepID=C5KG24_PERM5|nr:hypothetical protein Pmar_PMAR017476 [Perkinsus marinus ATCC 50983]EER16588.1 hypothetical protein Pmar_PMAR017476 [Perkinsus marinus ATCC 50983]|eukprot:XP_002784792.1 hypothetical protein Pmar_PMAR017476 [Perkinsus marinus ATCC 50983]
MQELARLTPGVLWKHADVEEPLKLRRESAVELVGMGVIIFATALGALALYSQRRATSMKAHKALRVAVIKKLKRQ